MRRRTREWRVAQPGQMVAPDSPTGVMIKVRFRIQAHEAASPVNALSHR